MLQNTLLLTAKTIVEYRVDYSNIRRTQAMTKVMGFNGSKDNKSENLFGRPKIKEKLSISIRYPQNAIPIIKESHF